MFVLLLLLAPALHALEVPPPPNAPFTDTAGIVSPSDADALNNKLRAFESETGAQFIIYIFPTIDDEVIEDFTIRCAERWKAGQARADNGLILFVFVKEKKIRIEVGHGLEGTITDAYSGNVIRDILQPRFREGRYAQGLNDAVDAIIARIKNKEAPVPQSERSARPRAPQREQRGIDLGTIIFIIFILLFVVGPIFGRRRRGCGGGGCFLPWFLMGGGGGGGITFGGGGGGGGGGGWSGGGGSFGGGGATGGW